MKVYWWHDGTFGELDILRLSEIEQVASPVPIHAQVYAPGSQFHWYHLNARNRVANVPVGACSELRAMLLLQGIPCQ